MLQLNRIKDYVNKPFRQAFARFSDFLQLDGIGDPSEKDRALIALLKWVALADGKVTDREISAFRGFLESGKPGIDVSGLIEYFRTCEPLPPSESVVYFSDANCGERMAAVTGLIKIALAGGTYTDIHRNEIFSFGEALDIPLEELLVTEKELVTENDRRIKLVRSGTGLLVAFIVLLVFILTATLLRSVIFGLILAYICLPLEKLYERGIVRRNPFAGGLTRRKGGGFSGKLVDRVRRFVGNDGVEPEIERESPEKEHHDNLVKRSCTFTIVSVVVAVLIGGFFLAAVGVNYVSNIGSTMRGWVDNRAQSSAVAMAEMDDSAVDASLEVPSKIKEDPSIDEFGGSETIYKISVELDVLKAKFQNIPLVSWGIGEISRTLNDPESQKRFFSALLQKSGGILQFSLWSLSFFATILVDVLLTIFFFSLFLRTVALNTDGRGKGQSLSTYCVRTVFNGHWLPAAREESMSEAERIVGVVVFKLKTWLKGYIILISIDFIVYSIVFTLLDVPYAMILGFIAGCGLLLPYIGPIVSALLTILVTLALGGDSVSGMQIAGIVAIYLIENGVVEQFFLYPAVIGEALGLTTLETIIVVLLGGIFAGITGMIFALPAAAITKYLVPQVYHTVKK